LEGWEVAAVSGCEEKECSDESVEIGVKWSVFVSGCFYYSVEDVKAGYVR
jgi:hypothetical protein